LVIAKYPAGHRLDFEYGIVERRLKLRRGMLLSMLIPCLLNAQEVCGFFNDDVIIQNARDLGRVGEEKWVVRRLTSSVRAIGKIRIKECFEDMIIASVSSEQMGVTISIGDRVVAHNADFTALLIRQQDLPLPPLYRNSAEPSVPAAEAAFRHLRIGLSLGTLLPYQTMHQYTHYSYQAGATVQYGFTPRSALLLDMMYSFMDERPFPNSSSELTNRSVLIVNALLRHGLFNVIYMDLGAGVYVPRFSVSATPSERQIETLEYHLGVCAGLAINFVQSNSLSMYLSPRYHIYQLGTELIENVTVGVNFIL
jgi:hypothetical protein